MHPSIAVAELMRLLVDERLLGWEPAWEITQRTFGYTNHTLLPEALETWLLSLFSSLLPRHLKIIYEINRRFLDDVRARYPGDHARAARLSLIDEHGEKRVRMAHLACVGSHAINGVSALDTDLLRQSVLRDFADLWPERFSNKTNGVTPRRFLAQSNPAERAPCRAPRRRLGVGARPPAPTRAAGRRRRLPAPLAGGEAREQGNASQPTWPRRPASRSTPTSDRAIREYCEDIWEVSPVAVALDGES